MCCVSGLSNALSALQPDQARMNNPTRFSCFVNAHACYGDFGMLHSHTLLH